MLFQEDQSGYRVPKGTLTAVEGFFGISVKDPEGQQVKQHQ